MAKFIALVLLALIAISMVTTTVMANGNTNRSRSRYGEGSVKRSQCGKECDRRCGDTQYHKPCIFFCNKCCHKCLCVPPGYYGNKQYCSCYDNWKTKRGGPKCP